MNRPTKKELSQVYFLNREIEHDQTRLRELEAFAEGRGIDITGMPKGSCTADTVGNCAAEIADIKNIIALNIQRCWYELNRLNRFIDGVTDSQMRMILTLRYVNGLPWQQVAFSIGEHDESYPRRMHNRFLKRAENAEEKSL